MKITMGRYQANRGMVELGWKTHVLGEGRKFGSSHEAIETLRQENPDVINHKMGSLSLMA
jgi:2,3-bisphosphoglycerate-independent phosphoglycerate mutase